MTVWNASLQPEPPQVGRTPPPMLEEEPRGLWSQLLTAFRDLSGAFDPFANDANPQVRALGRAARSRTTAEPDDFFALGDLCVRLTPQGTALSQTYAAKAIAAYSRAAEVEPTLEPVARSAILAFTAWIAETAQRLGSTPAIAVALLVLERVRAMGIGTTEHGDGARLRQIEDNLRALIERELHDDEKSDLPGTSSNTRIVEQAQMLLRQSKPEEALQMLDREVQAGRSEEAAWVWRGMALTDLGRFAEAISSYDRALDLQPTSAAIWNNKGALLMELERVEAALACFERAVGLVGHAPVPAQAVYWLNKGKALYLLGRPTEALAALTRSHELEPSAESAAGIAACRDRMAT